MNRVLLPVVAAFVGIWFMAGCSKVKQSNVPSDRTNQQASSELKCELTSKAALMGEDASALVFNIINVSSNDVYIRDVVLGYNLCVFVRREDENGYWPFQPLGVYLHPGMKVISPGQTLATDLRLSLPKGTLYLYAQFTSLETDTNATWHGQINSPVKVAHGGKLSNAK